MSISFKTSPVRLVAFLCSGILLGAIGLHVWLHEFRFSNLETETWKPTRSADDYAGSVSCRECHERFYKLWSPSHHGKAMQPVTPAFVKEELLPLAEPIAVGESLFHVDLANMQMTEEVDGTHTPFPMLHALGGKNVFFFLTPLERGRLQVLPLSFDIRRDEWFHTTDAMVRHFEDAQDEAIHWRDPLLTFNTACYNCHVSQLDKNYDASTDTYHTTWREPGINCEACHGPSLEHIRVCQAVPKGTVPQSIRISTWSEFSIEQVNDACAPCHAKTHSIAPEFNPGDRFFDYYGLTCLEDRDFYPDGRDLGENYTQTGWLMNPCAKSGMLSCTHCHTSSGRFRFKDNPNESCLPCHASQVKNIATHSHHEALSGATCVSCHMPMTEFGRMLRSDHTMRPPSPAAGARFGSPVACTLCHTDKSADWAADHVSRWHPDSHWQNRILQEGELVDAARNARWKTLPAMLAYLTDDTSDTVVVTSLIRLLANCMDASKWPAIRSCMSSDSPLVRAAATTALRDDLQNRISAALLLAALTDDYRLVRVRAVAALSVYPREQLTPQQLGALLAAEKEFLLSLTAQPDQWSGHYNLGNYRSDRGDITGALQSHQRAITLRNDVVQPYVNASVLASRLGHIDEAISYLKQAHAVSPDHGGVNFNLGLALAEAHDTTGAKKYLRLALKDAGSRPAAAYNLAVLLAEDNLDKAIGLCATAASDVPDNPRYGYTHAFYLDANNRADEAIGVLSGVIDRHPSHASSWVLKGTCLEKRKQFDEARTHYQAMRAETALPRQARAIAEQRLRTLP